MCVYWVSYYIKFATSIASTIVGTRDHIYGRGGRGFTRSRRRVKIGLGRGLKNWKIINLIEKRNQNEVFEGYAQKRVKIREFWQFLPKCLPIISDRHKKVWIFFSWIPELLNVKFPRQMYFIIYGWCSAKEINRIIISGAKLTRDEIVVWNK